MTLSAGQTLAFGTISTPNSKCSGDTTLYLYAPNVVASVASNDDAAGTQCSYATYTATTAGALSLATPLRSLATHFSETSESI